MTLEADVLYRLPREHSGVGRTMRLVTSRATFKAHRRVLKCEWTALVAVAIETAGLVRGKGLGHKRPKGPVRIVAIEAGHGPFRKPVVIGLLELGPDIEVTARALLVNCCPWKYQSICGVRMDLVAGGAGNRVFGVATL